MSKIVKPFYLKILLLLICLALSSTVNAVQIHAGCATSYVIKADNSLWVIGSNQSGELGDGTNYNTKTSWRKIFSDVKMVASGGEWTNESYTLVLLNNGKLFGAGRYDSGELGISQSSYYEYQMNWIQVLTNVDSISAFQHNSFAIMSNSNLYGTGENNFGQIGCSDNSKKYQWTFSNIDISKVETSGYHTLALKKNGDLYAVGNNDQGWFGTSNITSTANWIFVTHDVKNISTGRWHSLMLKTDGSLFGCGGNLGLGNFDNVTSWTKITNNITDISAGRNYSLILRMDNTLWATGTNWGGWLGTGTTVDTSNWVQVLNDVTAMSAGNYHSLALKRNGEVWAAGLNDNYQIGDGTNTSRTSWIKVLNVNEIGLIDDFKIGPNPVNINLSSIHFYYHLLQSSDIKLSIYDVSGTLIKQFTYSKDSQGAQVGDNKISWNGIEDNGRKLSTGAYIVFVSNDSGEKKKLIFLVTK